MASDAGVVSRWKTPVWSHRRCLKNNGKRAIVIVAGKPHKAGTCRNMLIGVARNR